MSVRGAAGHHCWNSHVSPRSVPKGVVWPGLPSTSESLVLGLLFQLEQSQWWSPERILAHQLRQLETLLAHASLTVPFYRDRLRDAGVGGGPVTLESFRRIPILTRRDLQENGERLLCPNPPEDHGTVGEVRSSGSTGRPVTARVSGVTTLYNRALNMRFHLWQGRDFAATVGSIRALNNAQQVEVAAKGTSLQWTWGFVSGPMLYFDILRPIDEQLAWLARIEPDVLLTYPSNLRALLEAARDRGMRLTRLREATLRAEVVDPDLPELCREVWGVPLSANYSANETGIIALHCREGRYHVQSETALVEILGDDGTPCRPGELGHVVVTDLHNFVMPLIRYEIGDYAEFADGCPCGRGLPAIGRIAGRGRNMFVRPSGEKFWPTALKAEVYKALAPARQIQIVQRTPERIDVRLVAPAPLGAAAEEVVRQRIVEAIGTPFELQFVYVDDIPRSRGGKFEDCVSEVAV